MSSKSNIEWTDATWNPIVGCSVLSPGCTNCYAMTMAARLEAMAGTCLIDADDARQSYYDTVKKVNGKAVWTGKVAQAPEHVLLSPLKRKKPTTYFVNSMGDLFHENIPDEWIDKVFAVMALCPQHTFQVLTKRAERMRGYFTKPHSAPNISLWQSGVCWAVDDLVPNRTDHSRQARDRVMRGPLPNVWLGVSTERQQEADERIPHLLQTPAAVRFISAEPLLGPIDLSQWLPQRDKGLVSLGGLDDQKGSHGGEELEGVSCAMHLPNSHRLPALSLPVAVPSDRTSQHGPQPVHQFGGGAIDGASDTSCPIGAPSPVDVALAVEQPRNVGAHHQAGRYHDGFRERGRSMPSELDPGSKQLPLHGSEAGPQPISDVLDRRAGSVGLNNRHRPVGGSSKSHRTPPCSKDSAAFIGWLIVGGESGPHARPMHVGWARDLRDQCAAAGVPFFFKQHGEWHPRRDNECIAPKCIAINGALSSGDKLEGGGDRPRWIAIERVGKKAAGRLLDGVEHNAMPKVTA